MKLSVRSIPEGWMEKKLATILVLNYGKALKMENRRAGDIPVYGSGGLIGTHDSSLVKGPGIIVGRKGNVGSVFWSDRDFFVIDTAYFVTSALPLRFLYYLLPSLNFINSDAAVPGLSRSQAYSLDVLIPPHSNQIRISSILSSYDDLIENSQRRIKILESMARGLYREWFVHFRFPGHENHLRVASALGEIPEGWMVKKLSEIAILNYGKALKKEDRCDGDFPVFGSGGVVGTHNVALVKGPGIIVGRKGNVGSVFWCDDDFFVIDTAYSVTSSLPLRYMFYVLPTLNFINSDAAVPGLSRNQAYSLDVLVPPQEVLVQFCELANTFEYQALTLNRQIQNLRRTRDLLLPRLLSGQISVDTKEVIT